MNAIKKLSVNALLGCIVFLVLTFPVAGQSFLNLDFEYEAEKGQPRKWAVEGEGISYFAYLDSTIAFSGKNSLHINQQNAKVYTFLRIPSVVIAGKTIKVEGYIQFGNSDSLQCRLVIAGPGSSVSFSSIPAVNSQKGWQKISISGEIPSNFSSDRLLIALQTSGTGAVQFDHVSIFINDIPYGNGPPDFKEPSKREIKILNKNAIPASTIDEPARNLTLLENSIGDATVIGLGENSHGSSPIYKLKLSLIKLLVQKFGFTVFALEMPVAEASRLDRYVQYGEGEKADIVRNLAYKSWQTREMMDILEWIKFYNITASQKVSFKGFDIQGMLADNKADSAKSRDERMAKNIERIIKTAGPGTKIIISADNTHISTESGKMGSYLKDMFGRNYLAWGFTFNTGTYSAYGPQKYYEVHPSFQGTAEYLFSKSRYKDFFLDLRQIKNISVLDLPIGFRNIGSLPQETTQFAEIILRDHFDIIAFISNSYPTTYLKE